VTLQSVSQELSHIALCHIRKNKKMTQDFQASIYYYVWIGKISDEYISMYSLAKLYQGEFKNFIQKGYNIPGH